MNRWTSMLGAALLVAFVATPAAAQAGWDRDRELGIKLGLNFSTLDGEGFDDAETRMAFTGGGFVRLGITDMLSIQPELMYSPKGVEEEVDVNGMTFTTAIELDYIEVPVLVRADVASGAMLAPYIYGGPAFAFEASCSITAEVDGDDFDEDCDEGEGLDRKSFDVGAMVGGGLSFPAGPGSILIEGRYNFGLINIADSDNEDIDVKNRAGSVLAGYSISLGR